MGLAHGPELGDLIYILLGAPVPYIFRRIPILIDGIQAYKLVGECYVYGIMDGEVMAQHGYGQQGFIKVESFMLA